jgi:hypothetical protein
MQTQTSTQKILPLVWNLEELDAKLSGQIQEPSTNQHYYSSEQAFTQENTTAM